jgi:hypothetical protein
MDGGEGLARWPENSPVSVLVFRLELPHLPRRRNLRLQTSALFHFPRLLDLVVVYHGEPFMISGERKLINFEAHAF